MGKENAQKPAPEQKPKQEGKATGYVVVERFRDALNRRRVYEAGEDVSGLPAERLASLVEKGLVAKQ